ncbi:hypothetical protein HK097_010345 [Rhizophlyctis rosea]|uniref:P-loop containing nucleoside triphosphate hydrolase protein n=1 Tax=Rhizophlyctis rosea TaxID=64517 RepID=A0AAD5SI66_9FUNG|nr:hypothetical protein HK097_010345 [Rhizophlyctis rosea]
MASSPTKVNLVSSQIYTWFSTLRPRLYPYKPLIIGINGLQGSGKTTLTTALIKTLSSPPYSLKIATLSTDDLYLTHSDQLRLAAANPTNPLLEFRGNPGTHDVDLGAETLSRILTAQTEATISQTPTSIPLPAYDKSLNNGRGDRLPQSFWLCAPIPLDILLFEGCYLGFKPISSTALTTLLHSSSQQPPQTSTTVTLGPHHLTSHTLQNLQTLLQNLTPYTQKWYPHISAFIHITAEDPSWVYYWRWEQELSLKSRLNNPDAGLSHQQVIDFVNRFAPMYVMCLPTLTEKGFFADENGEVPEEFEGRHLQVVLDKDREVVESRLI